MSGEPKSRLGLVLGILVLTSLAPIVLAEADPTPSSAQATSLYVDDTSCAICHSVYYKSYQEVGMARSFFRPSPDKAIEDWGGDAYFHEPSGRYYEMRQRDGRFVFRRYQLGPGGRPINVFEQEIRWVLGSGHRSRTYLYQTPSGEIYQLPVAWYTQTSSWAMAPGFDSADHQGVLRRVRRECLFCHNAYPETAPGADAHFEPQIFPTELPEGTGCQRCHGPAAEHVRAATEEIGNTAQMNTAQMNTAQLNTAQVRASIVNPGRLPAARRDDVCDQCHLQPAVALAGVRRFGRGDFSFRPGQSLADYMVQVDVEVEGETRSERFEINHHPYRLRQSRCFTESAGALTCVTCHDPHRKVPAERRAAHYRAACQTCHQVDDCRLQAMTREAGGEKSLADETDPLDCTGCHMQRRRAQDVVHVVMTDHLIRRRPGGPELLAPLSESVPVMVDVRPFEPRRAPTGDLWKMYRAVAVLRTRGRDTVALDHLATMIARVRPPQVEPYLDLAQGQITQGRFDAAERTLTALRRRHPDLPPQVDEWRALVHLSRGRVSEAVSTLADAARRHPGRAEAEFNLGVVLYESDQAEEAAQHLRRALAARPNMAPAWFYLGLAWSRLERTDDALASYRRVLEIDPTHGRAYLALGEIFLRRGERGQALRYWRHGARFATRPGPLVEALERVVPEEAVDG